MQTPNRPRISKCSLKIFSWFVAFSVLVTVGLAIHTCVFIANAQQATCTIEAVEIVKDNSGVGGKYGKSGRGPAYRPTIQYTGPQGRIHVVAFSIAAVHYNYDVGQKVAILYNPKDPQSVRFDNFLGVWAGTIVIGIISIFLACLLLAGWIGQMRMKHTA